MKLFLKEHALLVVIQIFQFSAVMSIYWLDGYRKAGPALYSIMLGLFLLGGYLCYQYYSRRQYYHRLQQPLVSLDDSIQRLDQAPISEALEQLLTQQYRYYQQQLATMNQQQQEHLTFMNQWVHQMKTPLSVIELTVQQVDEPEFASIREELERMRSGLDTILYMARLRTFEQDFHIRLVSLSEVIREVVHDHKRLFIRNQVYPDVQIRDGDILAETDQKWLFFMISQLVINAVKYSAPTKHKVIISLSIQNDKAIIEVQDQGVGIPASDLKRVFEPFFTGENGRHFRESTGMGLYLTREAAHRLDHQLELESTVGSGTTVRILFTSYQQQAHLTEL